MADISDEGLKLQVADISCAGKLLEDTKRLTMGGQRVEHLSVARSGETASCITFTSMDADSSLTSSLSKPPLFKTDGTFKGQTDGQTVVKAFFGVASNMAPGRPLAFDTDMRMLDFGAANPMAATIDSSPAAPSNLKFDNNKLGGTLIIGVNVRF